MLYLMMTLFAFLATMVSALGEVSPADMEMQRLGGLVRQFQNQLNISRARVLVSVVKTNERLVSVRPSRIDKETYLLEIDEKFLATLSMEEQRAALAHEMGHVWIFTHRRHKQSERLANRKALELVNETSLEKLYEKVWQLDGKHGNFEDYLAQKLSRPSPFSATPALR